MKRKPFQKALAASLCLSLLPSPVAAAARHLRVHATTARPLPADRPLSLSAVKNIDEEPALLGIDAPQPSQSSPQALALDVSMRRIADALNDFKPPQATLQGLARAFDPNRLYLAPAEKALPALQELPLHFSSQLYSHLPDPVLPKLLVGGDRDGRIHVLKARPDGSFDSVPLQILDIHEQWHVSRMAWDPVSRQLFTVGEKGWIESRKVLEDGKIERHPC